MEVCILHNISEKEKMTQVPESSRRICQEVQKNKNPRGEQMEKGAVAQSHLLGLST